ncbi:DNA mismatch repair protein MutS [Aliiroseovarius zhejiangensis]|uniref:DNA mismatch repair protein MutS n=1 Tax=Aliiroseovarius zhejiangensis TaxID=1632025 RepID=A0ABQ3J610_9RHOB|nr:Smr/MutS family protein [Aliiroseovarius zhejiangensis]GHF02528.1 DNA mismatch repair protein MutS [Aliiroseovarius zhejiangensis]
MARRPRHLSAEDKALWKKVADSTNRLHPARPLADLPAKNPTPPKERQPKARHPAFQLGQNAKTNALPHDLSPSLSNSVASQPVSMDRKTFGKMKKGRLSPESRIDLHGMTIAQAHPVLIRFILDAAAADRRLVLVITGKGKHRDDGGPIPVRHGVLRHQVPHWLNSMPLKQHVLQISEAHLKHGGQGAYYVYLRRRR